MPCDSRYWRTDHWIESAIAKVNINQCEFKIGATWIVCGSPNQSLESRGECLQYQDGFKFKAIRTLGEFRNESLMKEFQIR
jgi:hypothetical protein